MPVQHTFLGRPISVQMPPRRIQVVLFLIAFVAISLLLFGAPTSVDELPTVQDVKDTIKNPSIPQLPAFLGGPHAHKPPPVQANSTAGETRWYNDWKWKNPFSSSITLDENRAVLPPLKERPPVYTYYAPQKKTSKAQKEAEENLLLTWRRAWWAAGFKPVVLGRPEAMNNPLYRNTQRLQLDDIMETEISRWLAWGNMGTGILANYLTVPMATYDNRLLSFLRRGQYPTLTRYEGLKSGLFAGEKDSINKAIKQALETLAKPDNQKPKSIVDAVSSDTFSIDPVHDGVAYYDERTLAKYYKTISESYNSNPVKGLTQLATLINAHLHTAWQNFLTDIVLLKPLPEHMTILTEPALEIAHSLIACSESPLPSSCPPNMPHCKPCDAARPLHLAVSSAYQNSTGLYTIGTVPHPYTTTSLMYQQDPVDAKFVRRLGLQDRDSWVAAVTEGLFGQHKATSSSRIVAFKELVASERGAARALWLTAERESHKDLNWIFGFDLPRNSSAPARSSSSSSFLKDSPDAPGSPASTAKRPSAADLDRERALLDRARDVVKSSVRQQILVKDAVEAWNLADSEAWKFARAFSARRRVERLKWEEEEHKYAGAEEGRKAGKGSWGRWFDT